VGQRSIGRLWAANAAGADDGDAGQRGQDLAGGVGEQVGELALEHDDVGGQAKPSIDIAAQAPGAKLGIRRRRQELLPALDPEAGVRVAERPGDRACSERTDGGRPANATAQANTAWPEASWSLSARPWPTGADRPGQSTLSWSCRRCWSTRRASTSWRR
jgi:hypothetical protein